MIEIADQYVDKAKKLVLEKFPEMAGAEPSVSERRSQSKDITRLEDCSVGSMRGGRYVLTFEKDVSLPGGHSMKRLVRVTMDESGEVVRLTSSK